MENGTGASLGLLIPIWLRKNTCISNIKLNLMRLAQFVHCIALRRREKTLRGTCVKLVSALCGGEPEVPKESTETSSTYFLRIPHAPLK